MARYCCFRRRRLRNVFICVCSPCICLALLFAYASLVVCLRMHNITSKGPLVSVSEKRHFVAPGTLSNNSFSPLPKYFWALDPHKGAIWNHLQLPIDRYFSPILHPKNKQQPSSRSFSEFILKQSSTVTNLESMRKNFDKLPQPIQDFVNHMDKRDYPTLIQPGEVCGAGAKDEKEPPLLLLAIKTTELNFKNRQAIRQTWGQVGWVAGHNGNSSGGYVRRVFLLGKGNPQDQGVDSSELLILESKHYGDILQWDFTDTFFNLTLKDIHFWRWFLHFCGQTQFVFKGDDDVFVNTPNMVSYLQDQLNNPQANKTMKNFMVGEVIGAAMPSRANFSKYFIPDTFYKGLYPAYAGGGGVVYSGLLTKRLHDMSKRVHLFPIDDVYVGMCMVRLNASPVHHPAFLTFGFSEEEEKEPCSYHTILLVHKRSPSQVVELWGDLMKTRDQCRNVNLRDKDTKRTSTKDNTLKLKKVSY